MVESLFQLQNSDGYDSASSISNASGVVGPHASAMVNANMPGPQAQAIRNEQSLTWVGIAPVAEKMAEAKERTVKFVANVRA